MVGYPCYGHRHLAVAFRTRNFEKNIGCFLSVFHAQQVGGRLADQNYFSFNISLYL